MKTLYLCGAGNSEGVRLALNVNDRERRWSHIALLDDDPARHGRNLLGVVIEGPLSRLADVAPGEAEVVNLVARTTLRRDAVARRLSQYGVPFAQLIHPSVDRRGAELAADVLVYEGAVLAPEVTIASGCVVFMRAVVGHESSLAEGCVMAAGSVLNARVVLERRVYVGANAVVLPELHVGADATLGACSAVVCDVPEGATAIGVPAEVVARAEGALPWPRANDAAALQLETAAVLPLATQIAELWAKLLCCPRIDLDQGFFEAGGTSLLALQARAQLRQQLGVELAVTDLFRYTSARRLALRIAGSAGPAGRSPGAARARARLNALARRANA
jgi:sugar O-acyltransferase (sialic acid O-acetyltransferase NeuD family)